jgi:hyperosmotically inducible protein
MHRLVLGLLILGALLAPVAAAAQSTARDVKFAKVEDASLTPETGNTFRDSWLTTKTKTKLVTDGRVKARHITVETYAGVVTLRGKVESAEEKSAAESISRNVDGVKSVTNLLQVVPLGQRRLVDAQDQDIVEAAKARVARDEQLQTAEFKIRSDNGMVTLLGAVPDARTKSRAAELVRSIPGVKTVRNELRPKS